MSAANELVVPSDERARACLACLQLIKSSGSKPDQSLRQMRPISCDRRSGGFKASRSALPSSPSSAARPDLPRPGAKSLDRFPPPPQHMVARGQRGVSAHAVSVTEASVAVSSTLQHAAPPGAPRVYAPGNGHHGALYQSCLLKGASPRSAPAEAPYPGARLSSRLIKAWRRRRGGSR